MQSIPEYSFHTLPAPHISIHIDKPDGKAAKKRDGHSPADEWI
jgi:hypothetical protein